MLRARLDPTASLWLDQAIAASGVDALAAAYTSAGRHVGRHPLAPSQDERREAGDLQLDRWTTRGCRACRAPAGARGSAAVTIACCYERGDSSEQQSWLKSIAVLPEPERLLPVVIDACRTNILPLFEAIACENPYPARHFPERNFNQMVLKALFNRVALSRIVGLAGRLNPELARMAADYAAERRAAGRDRASGHRPGHDGDCMKIFDPHIHMTSRTTDDYEAMAAAGIVAVVEPAFWLGQPRTHVGTFEDYFNCLLGWERFRASQFGIRHFCTIGLNPKEANNPKLADEVLALLPRYLEKDGVVAVGEIGFDDQTDAEEACFAEQLELARAHDLPVLIHTPHRDKKRGTSRTIELVRR